MDGFDLSRVFFVLRGALQPVLYSWALTVLFALLFYVTTASAPTLGDVTWDSAAQLTTCLWVTTFGGRCSMGVLGASTPAGAGYVQLPPLLLTLVVLYALAVICRKRMVHSWGEVALVGAVQAGLVAMIGAAMRLQGPWWIAVVGVGALGALAALWAGREFIFEGKQWWERCESLLPRMKKLFVLLCACAAIGFLVAAVVGARKIVDIQASYMAGIWGGVGIFLVQVLYLPTVLMWVLSWLLGAGFSVGEGSYFSIFGTLAQPLPAIPLFGALPHNSAWAVLVLIPVIAAIVWRSWRDWRKTDIRSASAVRGTVIDSMIVALGVGGVIVALAWMSRGSLGPGRMAVVGTRAEFMVVALVVVVGIPYVVTALLTARAQMKKAVPVKEGQNQEPKIEKQEPVLRAAADAKTHIDATLSEVDTAVGADVDMTRRLGMPTSGVRVEDLHKAAEDTRVERDASTLDRMRDVERLEEDAEAGLGADKPEIAEADKTTEADKATESEETAESKKHEDASGA
ncbi:MAG: DUF6350 family protein [Actinomycetaceae bacterium]|nr:DUF6350 family protein [Actinomycetaceae bacterium]MDY5272604.1 DUF6350 family protein [Arcanobacterium sp.]